jgi:hypothetical protein
MAVVRVVVALGLALVFAPAAASLPPAAWVDTSAGRTRLAQSSYCWSEQGKGGTCADYLPPRCGDGRTPRIPVRLGETMRFRLAFYPRSVSLQFPTGATRSYRLRKHRVIAWRVQHLGAFALTAQARWGDDTSYAGCFVARR